MCSNFEFADKDRYGTDCGPACPQCKQPDDDTLWLYTCQWPYSMALGVTACCHVYVWFALTTERPCPLTNPSASGKPTLQDIKRAHYVYRASQHDATTEEAKPPSVPCCEIKWIDASGNPTPDTNPSIGYVYRIAHRLPPDHFNPDGVYYAQTPYSRICAAHKERLDALPYWRFVAKL